MVLATRDHRSSTPAKAFTPIIILIGLLMAVPPVMGDYGTILTIEHPEVVPLLNGFSTGPSLCYTDESDEGDSVSAVYLARDNDCDWSSSNDLRLTPVAEHPAGSKVSTSHSDAFAQYYEFVEGEIRTTSETSPAFQPGDDVYVAYCLQENCSIDSQVDSGWVRLTPTAHNESGTFVLSGDEDFGTETSFVSTEGEFTHNTRFWDLSQDDSFNSDDVAYWFPGEPNDEPTVAAVRLGSHDVLGPHAEISSRSKLG